MLQNVMEVLKQEQRGRVLIKVIFFEAPKY